MSRAPANSAKAMSSEAAPAHSRLWAALNSPFVLFLLSSVVLTLIGRAFSAWSSAEETRRTARTDAAQLMLEVDARRSRLQEDVLALSKADYAFLRPTDPSVKRRDILKCITGGMPEVVSIVDQMRDHPTWDDGPVSALPKSKAIRADIQVVVSGMTPYQATASAYQGVPLVALVRKLHLDLRSAGLNMGDPQLEGVTFWSDLVQQNNPCVLKPDISELGEDVTKISSALSRAADKAAKPRFGGLWPTS